MNVKGIVLVGVGALLLALISGCAKVPQKELDEAKAAVEAAKNAEADRYIPDQFTAANDSLNVAQSEIEKQNAKTAISRNYEGAKRMLAAAKSLAEQAASAAGSKKAEIESQTQALIEELEKALGEAKTVAKKAKKKAVKELEKQIEAIEDLLSEAKAALAAGDVQAAQTKAQMGIDSANSIK